MRILLLFICISISLACFAQKPISYHIDGNIKGLGNDSVVILVSNYDALGSRAKADTLWTKATQDHFVLNGTLPGPRYVWSTLGPVKARKNFSFFIEHGNISLVGNLNDPDNISVTGTPSNNDQTQSRKVTGEMYSRIKALRTEMQNHAAGSNEYSTISNQISAKFDSIQAYEIKFVETHPNSLASGTYLYVLQDKIPLEDLEYLYGRLGSEVKNSGFGLIVREKIKARRFVAVGKNAPGFTSKDTSGNVVNFASFRGKYVLLEFWASWCVPCRQQSPHLAEVYKKYSNKGFTIVQYSIDDKKGEEKWKEAILKDQLVWTQLSDLDGFESKVSKLYGVQPIPDNFLIDPNGKIIGRRLEGKELDEMLQSVLK